MKSYEKYLNECTWSDNWNVNIQTATYACQIAESDAEFRFNKELEAFRAEIIRLTKERDEALEREKIACKVIEEKRKGIIHMKKIDPENLPEGQVLACSSKYREFLTGILEIDFEDESNVICDSDNDRLGCITHYLPLSGFKLEECLN